MTQKLDAKRVDPADDEVPTTFSEVLTTFSRTMREGDTIWLLDRTGVPLGRIHIERARNGRARVALTARRWIRIERMEDNGNA